jgi:hypothetical protein
MGPRRIGLNVLNFFHVRIGTHVDGIRDPEHPCSLFELGKPDGRCLSDGHYVCRECTQFDPRRDDAEDGPELSAALGDEGVEP